MSDYQTDLLRALLWLVGGMGATTIAAIGLVFRRYETTQHEAMDAINGRLDAQDEKLSQIKSAVDADARQMRELIHDIDRRLVKMEAGGTGARPGGDD